MSYLTTIQKLKAILDTVSVTVLPVKFEYQETMPTSFPAGVILFAGSRERMLDTVTNAVVARYLVRMIFPVEESQAAQEKWLTLLDTVAVEFRKSTHQTLDGTATKFMIEEAAAPSVSADYSQPVIYFDVYVSAEILKSIT